MKYIRKYVAPILVAGLVLNSLISARQEYQHMTAHMFTNQTPLVPAVSLYGQLLLPKLTAVLTIILVVLGMKSLLVGEPADKTVEPAKDKLKNARALVLLSIGLLVFSSISAILPYLTVTPSSDTLSLFATITMFLSIVPLYILQKHQTNMFWIKLRNTKALDERQLRDRLQVTQKAYWLSGMLIAIFLFLAVDLLPEMLFTIQSNIEPGGSINGITYFNWQPFVCLLIAVLWMPAMVAALHKQPKLSDTKV